MIGEQIIASLITCLLLGACFTAFLLASHNVFVPAEYWLLLQDWGLRYLLRQHNCHITVTENSLLVKQLEVTYNTSVQTAHITRGHSRFPKDLDKVSPKDCIFLVWEMMTVFKLNFFKKKKVYSEGYLLLQDGCQVSGWWPEMLRQIFFPTSNLPFG